MSFSNSSLVIAALALGLAAGSATAQTDPAPGQTDQAPQAPGAKSDITRVQAGSDTSGSLSGQGKSFMPSTGAGSLKGSGQGEGSTSKETIPRD